MGAKVGRGSLVDGAHPEGTPRRLMGAGIGQRGGPRAGGIAGQALGMGRRVLLRQRGT